MRTIQLLLTIGAAAATIPAQVIPEWTGGTHAYLSASIVRAGKASVCIPTGISRLSQDVNIAGHRVRFAWFETAARHVQGEQQGNHREGGSNQWRLSTSHSLQSS